MPNDPEYVFQEGESLQPDLAPVVDAVWRTIRDWFPDADLHECDELAFAICRSTLHLRHVEGELWAVTIDSGARPQRR